MTDLRTVLRAEVYKAGVPAATLTRGDGIITFAYLADYDGPAAGKQCGDPWRGHPAILRRPAA